MCNRISLPVNVAEVVAAFDVDSITGYPGPRYNIPVQSNVAVIVADDGKRRLDVMKWGLVPAFSAVPKYQCLLSNARADTLEKPKLLPNRSKPLMQSRLVKLLRVTLRYRLPSPDVSFVEIVSHRLFYIVS